MSLMGIEFILPGDLLSFGETFIRSFAGIRWSPEESPSPRKLEACHRLMTPLARVFRKGHPFFLRHQQGSQSFKAIRSHPALRDQFSQRLLDSRRKQSRQLRQLAKKERPPFHQLPEDIIGFRGE